MRVTELKIQLWRNLRNVDLRVESDSPLVCLVGENGTGKSAVLELLSATAHHLGIAQGVEIARGNPFEEPHDIEIVVSVPTHDLVMPESMEAQIQSTGDSWNGVLTFRSCLNPESGRGMSVEAGGLPEPLAQSVGQGVVELLRERKETQHLYLDADRAYPPMQIEPHRYGEIWQQEWDSPEFTRQWAFRPTRTLYEEWMKYFIGVEERAATAFVTEIRRARDAGTDEPSFVDPFDGYRSMLLEVLPHLHFVGVEPTGARRTPLFDSAGLELPFSRLSGGEREISFLAGQIERFQLRRGLLLIDEPELHLNPDLLRNWLAFLRDTVEEGQVWIATHSLEAVEVAGPQSTFVFERDPDARTVTSPSRLAGRPVLSALSAAVGSPAFTITRLRFIYIEGDRQSRERERFYAVCGDPEINRFLEGGSCNEVIRRLTDVRALAVETDEQLHVGGVVDRDFRSDAERLELIKNSAVHVLQCHEVENLYLQPSVVEVLLGRAGQTGAVATSVVRDAADRFAGLWVAHRAASVFSTTESVPKQAISALGGHSFTQLAADWPKYRDESASGIKGDSSTIWFELLNESWEAFNRDRETDDWYRRCLGKQTLSQVATALDISSSEALERNVVHLWNTEAIEIPEDLRELRAYVARIGD